MAQQIRFFEKNFLHSSNKFASVTASQNSEIAYLIRSSSLRQGFMTTDSADADNTTIQVLLGDVFLVDSIFLIEHNFKSYLVEYYDIESETWKTLYTVTDDLQSTTLIKLETPVFVQSLRITVYGTQVADTDKVLTRLVVTKELGQFKAWPEIKNPRVGRAKIVRKSLSGKKDIFQNIGFFECTLEVKILQIASDLALIEQLQRQHEGFETWICGGDEEQFYYAAEGYRKKDLFLMLPESEWDPELYKGIYTAGYKFSMDLVEVIR